MTLILKSIALVVFLWGFLFIFNPLSKGNEPLKPITVSKNNAVLFPTKYYLTRKGDTLLSLAVNYGISIKGLLYLNQGKALDFDPIKPLASGFILKVPLLPLKMETLKQFMKNIEPDKRFSLIIKAKYLPPLPKKTNFSSRSANRMQMTSYNGKTRPLYTSPNPYKMEDSKNEFHKGQLLKPVPLPPLSSDTKKIPPYSGSYSGSSSYKGTSQNHKDPFSKPLKLPSLPQKTTKTTAPSSNYIKNLLKSKLVSNVTQGANFLFNRYGTANFRLNLSDKFQIADMGFDMLLPLYDQSKNLIFTQASFDKDEQKTQMNLGLGYRYFNLDSMYGLNVFFDHAFIKNYSRLGFGAEYGRDYFRINANGYFRLEDWKSSDYFEGDTVFETRVANGVDLRLNAYLPAHPQLGTGLAFEQYFGDNVALLSETKRAKNPNLLKISLHYTPIPLIRFKADYSRVDANNQTSFLGMDVAYRFKTPLKDQMDFAYVDKLRRLKGARYELVDRRKDIVLDYKNDSPIFRFKSPLRGWGGQKLPLVEESYLPESWQIKAWHNPFNLVLSEACQDKNNLSACTVTLPDYNANQRSSDNFYNLDLIFKHEKTGKEKTFSTQIRVVEKSANLSTYKIEGYGGTENLPVFENVDVLDIWKIEGWDIPDAFDKNGGLLSPSCYSLENLAACLVNLPYHDGDLGDNKYTLQFKMTNQLTNQSCSWPVYVVVHQSKLPDLAGVSGTLAVDNQLLDYGKKAHVTLTLKDANNQLIDINETFLENYLEFKLIGESVSKVSKVSEIKKESPGIYSVVVTAGSFDETFEIEASYLQKIIDKVEISVLDPGIDKDTSSFSVNKKVGKLGEVLDLEFFAKNKQGTPLKGASRRIKLWLEATNDQDYELSKFIEIEPGTYQATLVSNVPSDFMLTPYVRPHPTDVSWRLYNDLAIKVGFEPAAIDEKLSSFSVDKSVLEATGITAEDLKTKAILSLKAKDTENKPIVGLESILEILVYKDGSVIETLYPVASVTQQGIYSTDFGLKDQYNRYREKGIYSFRVRIDGGSVLDLVTQVTIKDK